jgi:hypothetical protein
LLKTASFGAKAQQAGQIAQSTTGSALEGEGVAMNESATPAEILDYFSSARQL